MVESGSPTMPASSIASTNGIRLSESSICRSERAILGFSFLRSLRRFAHFSSRQLPNYLLSPENTSYVMPCKPLCRSRSCGRGEEVPSLLNAA